MFSGDYEKTREAAALGKQTSPSPPSHPLPAERWATAVPAQPPLLHRWKVCSLLLGSCFRCRLRKVTEFWKQHVAAHSRAPSLAQALPERAEVASSFLCAEVGPRALFFLPAAILYLSPQRQLSRHQVWWGKRALWGSFEEYGATLQLFEGQRIWCLCFFGGRSVNSSYCCENMWLSAMNSLQINLSGLRVQTDDLSGESLTLVEQTCKQVETVALRAAPLLHSSPAAASPLQREELICQKCSGHF